MSYIDLCLLERLVEVPPTTFLQQSGTGSSSTYSGEPGMSGAAHKSGKSLFRLSLLSSIVNCLRHFVHGVHCLFTRCLSTPLLSAADKLTASRLIVPAHCHYCCYAYSGLMGVTRPVAASTQRCARCWCDTRPAWLANHAKRALLASTASFW